MHVSAAPGPPLSLFYTSLSLLGTQPLAASSTAGSCRSVSWRRVDGVRSLELGGVPVPLGLMCVGLESHKLSFPIAVSQGNRSSELRRVTRAAEQAEGGEAWRVWWRRAEAPG